MQSAAGALCALMTLASATTAQADDSWTSIYDGTPFEGAGWSACPTPVTVTVDTRALAKDQRGKAKAAMTEAIQLWNKAKIAPFVFGGELPVTFNATTHVSTPTDGRSRDRHIYFTIVKATADQAETGVVGLATPLRVDSVTSTILEGSAAFQAQYVNKQSEEKVRELFAHELGHVFGLGHSTSKKDVMYPVLQGHSGLGQIGRAHV